MKKAGSGIVAAVIVALLAAPCGPAGLARADAPPGSGLVLVCLDPGHGGNDSGANYNGVQEKLVNLDIALRAKPIIERMGYRVLMTRTDDSTLSLQERCDIANRANATIFVSIHNNAYLTDSEGTETFCYYNSEEGRRLATAVHRQVVKRIKLPDRGVKEAGFYVLKHTDMTSALVEGAFLTNPAEALLLQDPRFRQKIAEGIAAGIDDFLMDPGRFDEYILVMNPDPARVAEVEFTYMNASGRESSRQLEVPPLSRATFHVDEDEPNTDLSTLVTSVNGVPVVAERAMYFGFERGIGGHDSPGATEPSSRWYMAEGSTDWGFSTYLLIQNPLEVENPVAVRFMRSDGRTVDYRCTMAPHTRFTLDCSTVPGVEKADFSIRVTAESPVVAERAMYFKDREGRSGGHDSLGVTAPSRRWLLAEGYTGRGFDTYLLLQNPSSSAASARVRYMLPGGKVVSATVEVAPHSRKTVHVDEVPGLESTDVSIEVVSTVGVIAERSMYFDYFGIREGNNAPGANSPSRVWYLAEGCTRVGFDTYILLQNPSGKDTGAILEFLLADGTVKKMGVHLEARSRRTVKVNEVGGMGAAEFSTRVSCGEPIVVERASYFNYGPKPGGTNDMGVTGPALQWYFAEGCTR